MAKVVHALTETRINIYLSGKTFYGKIIHTLTKTRLDIL